MQFVITAYDGAGMLAKRMEVRPHVYPLWPCPEGKEARKEIAEIITKVKF